MGKTTCWGFLICIIISLTLLSCTPTTTTAPTASPPPAVNPTIKIASPADGASLPLGDVKISVQVSNFNLVDKLGKGNAPGEGHINYFLDVDPPLTLGQPAVTAIGTYAATAAPSYTWPNLKPGTHTLWVELVNNDHTPINPQTVTSVKIVVQPGNPTIKISSPADTSIVAVGYVKVTAEFSNFNVVDKIGQSNNPGEGHIIFYVDETVPTVPYSAATTSGTSAVTAETFYWWHITTEGKHTFSAQLVNNDNKPLDPPKVATVSVNAVKSAVTINLSVESADYLRFDLKSITVPAGANVTIVFFNKNSGMPHNFSLYENRAATKAIFRGDIVVGNAITTYNFTAPTQSGTYFFRCDLHPTLMTGDFIVVGPAEYSKEAGGAPRSY